VREIRSLGSVRGVPGNRHSYRDSAPQARQTQQPRASPSGAVLLGTDWASPSSLRGNPQLRQPIERRSYLRIWRAAESSKGSTNGSHFLFRAVVTASRNWVCVRPATYESAVQAEVLLSYFAGRQGALENTVLALLDLKSKMISYRAGRSPGMLYDTSAEFAEALTKHGKAPGKREIRSLPVVANLRLGMNMAACDSVPLVVAYASDPKGREQLAKRLAVAAWSQELVGRALYVVCAKEEFEAFDAVAAKLGKSKSGVLVLDLDDYGREASLLSKLSAGLKSQKLLDELTKAIDAHEAVARDHRQHVRNGKRQGIQWSGEIETTDSNEKGHKADR